MADAQDAIGQVLVLWFSCDAGFDSRVASQAILCMTREAMCRCCVSPGAFCLQGPDDREISCEETIIGSDWEPPPWPFGEQEGADAESRLNE